MLGSLPANARDSAISIPATTLDAALMTLAREANVEIISIEPGLRSVRTRAVKGSMSIRRALDRLLEGSGYRAIPVAGGGYRVLRGVISRPSPRPEPASSPPASGPAPRQAAPDIIITASKQHVPLLRYPGSLTRIGGDRSLKLPAGDDLTDIARTMPVLQSTELGPGRNKVFIRGVADSSFNGSTQSPASTYLDDVQLNYSGPDPALRLYDMQSVEILEGPQGTLYGSGAIGGVIRLTSNPVDLSAAAASMSSGVTLTEHGDPGIDMAGMINLPIDRDRLGLRAVAYGVRDGGYIDDPTRGLRNINRTDTFGGRLALRFDPDSDWRVEASGAMQWIRTRDGQYADNDGPPLARRSPIAQPFDDALFFGRMAVSKEWSNGMQLFSATGIVAYNSADRFDATPAPDDGLHGPVIYKSSREKWLVSQETRLSRSSPNGNSWLAGFTLVRDMDILSRQVGTPDTSASIIGVTNVTKAGSVFGEATSAVTSAFFLTVGGRLTAARVDGQPSSKPRSANYIKGRSTFRFDPTIAASWLVAPRTALFARYQTGYRTGGLAVAPGIGRVSDYRADAITVSELGVRRMRSDEKGLAFSGSVSLAHWAGIQADLINRRGQPYTANIGDAWIRSFEGTINWIPLTGLTIDGAFLFTDNEVSGSIADQSKRDNRRLPETPPFAANSTVSYRWTAGRVAPTIALTAGYIGRSVLGTGDLLDVSQGNYLTLGGFAEVRLHSSVLMIAAENLANRAGNRFAFGNPFTLGARDQATPLRPRNIRVQLSTAW